MVFGTAVFINFNFKILGMLFDNLMFCDIVKPKLKLPATCKTIVERQGLDIFGLGDTII